MSRIYDAVASRVPKGSRRHRAIARVHLRASPRKLREHWVERGEHGAWPNFARTSTGIVGHRALLLGDVTFCGRRTAETSTAPIRTLIGWTCLRCTRTAHAVKKASREWEKTNTRPGL